MDTRPAPRSCKLVAKAVAALEKVRRGRRGASSLEFALCSIPAIFMTYGVMEASWQIATLAALDHATLRAARFGTTGLAAPPNRTGAPSCRSAAIPWFAAQVTGGFLKVDRLTVGMSSFDTLSAASERTSGTTGPGRGGQIVTYELTYTQPFLIGGVVRLITGTDQMTFRSSLILKNEPFDNDNC